VNDWGVEKWFNPLTSPKVELKSVGDRVYRTPAGSGIPACFAIDDIVEYVVWGVHSAIDLDAHDAPMIQGADTFKNPEWYRKYDPSVNEVVSVNLNSTNVWPNGWSPYFWVYSCAPGTFFVNEIRAWFSNDPGTESKMPEYIELIGPAGADVGGWNVSLMEDNWGGVHYYGGLTIPAGKKLPADTETGWGFFTWADSWAKTWTNLPFRVDAEFADSSSKTTRNLNEFFGILVSRSNGMYEQAVRVGDERGDSLEGDYWVDAADANRPVPAGPFTVFYSSSLTSANDAPGTNVDDFEWTGTLTPTPGAPNLNETSAGDYIGQVLADIGGAVVALVDPDGRAITDADVLAWIESFGAKQADIDKLSADEFNEDFLLNLDLTKECAAELKITSIQIVDGVVYLNVSLVRTEGGAPVGTRAINGVLRLRGKADLAAGTFSTLGAAQVGNGNFATGNSSGIEYVLSGQNPPAFFRAFRGSRMIAAFGKRRTPPLFRQPIHLHVSMHGDGPMHPLQEGRCRAGHGNRRGREASCGDWHRAPFHSCGQAAHRKRTLRSLLGFQASLDTEARIA
jgi:hypothetical protein